MKASALIAKLQQFQPDAEISEVDVLRLFNDDIAVRDVRAKDDAVKAFLARGDLDGLREFIEAEKAKLHPGN